MNRKSSFGELGSFKSAVKREKIREIPEYNDVYVTLKDAASGIDFELPVCLVKSVFHVNADYPVVQIVLHTGVKYYAVGTVTDVLGKISEAKIRSNYGQEASYGNENIQGTV